MTVHQTHDEPGRDARWPKRFAGRVAVVTGAGSGIGRATAKRLAGEDATVACLDVVGETAAKTAAEIASSGGTAADYACDVADPGSVDGTVAKVIADHGTVDVLCNIAGIGKFAHTHDSSVEDWDRIIAVNLTGTFLMARAVLPTMLERGRGVIVNTASTAGVTAQPYSAAYCASKGGVVLLTRALAWEYAKRGVRVMAIAPGGVDTPIIQSFGYPDGADTSLLARMMSPMGFSQPEDLAGLFAYVASDEARFMTGSVVLMDGGMIC